MHCKGFLMVDVREVDRLRSIWPVRPRDRDDAEKQQPAKRRKQPPKGGTNQDDDDHDQPHVDTYA